VLPHTDNTVRVSDTETGKDISTLSHQELAHAVALSADARYAASGSRDGTAKLIETATGRQVTLVPADCPVRALSFTPENNVVLLCENGIVRIFDVLNKPSVHPIPADAGTVVAISRNGRYLATSSISSANDPSALDLGIIEHGTGQRLLRKAVPIDLFTAGTIRFSLDEKYLVAAGPVHGLKVYETATGNEVFSEPVVPGRVAEAIGGDGRTVAWATASSIETLKIDPGMSVVSRKTLKYPNAVFLELSFDGRYIAAGRAGPGLAVIDADTGREVFHVDQQRASNAAFSFDGRYLITFAMDNSLSLSAVPDGKVLWQLSDVGLITKLFFSHDGSIIAAGGGREPVFRLIETATGQTLSTIQISSEAEPAAAAFSADGRYLHIADDTSISRHYLRHEDLIDQACAILTRNIPQDEWNSWVRMPYRLTCPDLH
jgi:WD40 repeat protein